MRHKGVNAPHIKPVADSPTQRLAAPEKVTIPLTQHIGAPNERVVEKGQSVYVGSVLGKPTGFVGAYTHSSVSGVVVDVLDVLFPDSSLREAVVIENDGTYTADPSLAPPNVTTREDLVDAISRSGLVGLGGAGFPTHVKLAPAEGKPAPDHLIINAAECEPYITTDLREILEHADDIVEGVLLVKRLLEIPNVVIGIERDKPNAIALMREKFKDHADVSIKSLKTNYPQGAEKVLIASATNRAVPMGGLPADAGCVVLNVSTVSFIAKYLKTGIPLVTRTITVAGGTVKRPGNYIVPIGTSIRHILESCGVERDEVYKILLGGPMMGISLPNYHFPLLKYNNAILAMTEKETIKLVDNPCIRCGRCPAHCPMRLSPVEISDAYDRKDLETIEKLHINDCIECGCCSFICPAGRHLTQTMRLSKQLLREAVAKK